MVRANIDIPDMEYEMLDDEWVILAYSLIRIPRKIS